VREPRPAPLLVVVVDDDGSVRRSLSRLMRSGGLAVKTFASGEEMLGEVDSLEVSCAILDVHLSGGQSGLDLQDALRRRRPGLPVVIITGDDDPENQRRALAAGAAAYLFKPFPNRDLLRAVLSAIEGS
jgi:FixJ family two-component response regulator